MGQRNPNATKAKLIKRRTIPFNLMATVISHFLYGIIYLNNSLDIAEN